jgi:hypothetical protein
MKFIFLKLFTIITCAVLFSCKPVVTGSTDLSSKQAPSTQTSFLAKTVIAALNKSPLESSQRQQLVSLVTENESKLAFAVKNTVNTMNAASDILTKGTPQQKSDLIARTLRQIRSSVLDITTPHIAAFRKVPTNKLRAAIEQELDSLFNNATAQNSNSLGGKGTKVAWSNVGFQADEVAALIASPEAGIPQDAVANFFAQTNSPKDFALDMGESSGINHYETGKARYLKTWVGGFLGIAAVPALFVCPPLGISFVVAAVLLISVDVIVPER